MRVHIIGAGGFARETAALIRASGAEVEFHGKGSHPPPGALAVAAIGSPAARFAAVADEPDVSWTRAVAPRLNESVFVGAGSIICEGVVVTVDVEIGAHCIINMSCTIGHDTRIGAFTTLSPGVHLGGNVTVGDGVFIGSGAVVREGVTIGDGAVVGAGAVVLADVAPAVTVLGIPARPRRSSPGAGCW